MTILHPAYVAALEWFHASGERTSERLSALIDFYETSSALHHDPEMEPVRQQWRAETMRRAGFDRTHQP